MGPGGAGEGRPARARLPSRGLSALGHPGTGRRRPERIKIAGCFIRLEGPDYRHYRYGKPVEGFVYLSLDTARAAECRVEWATWQKAAGTGKAVNVGSCHEAGPFLTVKLHKPGEAAGRPDAVYTAGVLGRFGGTYADGDLGRETPVTDLIAFAKARRGGAARP